MSIEDLLRAIIREELAPVLEELRKATALRAVSEVSALQALSVGEAATLSGFSESAILDAIANKDLIAAKPGGSRQWRILRTDFEGWLRGAGKPADAGSDQDIAARLSARLRR